MTSKHKKRRIHPVPEDRVFARERFRVQLQAALHNLMGAKGVSQRELAERLGVSEARVSQMFSSAGNLTVRTVGEVFHALGCNPKVWVTGRIMQMTTECDDERDQAEPRCASATLVDLSRLSISVVGWREESLPQLPRSDPQVPVPLPRLFGPARQPWSTSAARSPVLQ
jgi:transcriptional regulator with XRE-family HTH domain